MSDPVGQAQQLLQRGEPGAAAAVLKQAEAAGNALAARELAVWRLTGHPLGRDLAAARALFERAAALGDEISAPVVRAFVAGGVGGPADWPRAIALLRSAAASDAEAASQLALIEAMDLTPDGRPAGGHSAEVLRENPDIRLFRGLFTPDECAYLVRVAAPGLRPSVVVDPASGRQVANPIRTSSAVAFPFVDEDPAIHALNRRLAAVSGCDVRAGEPLQVLRYAPGEQYRPHSDALPGIAPDQQRVLTLLVYLNDDYEGGETAFPELGLEVRGRSGDGLLFRNAAANGVPDRRMIHAGLPVTRGVKFLASRWIRAAPLVL